MKKIFNYLYYMAEVFFFCVAFVLSFYIGFWQLFIGSISNLLFSYQGMITTILPISIFICWNIFKILISWLVVIGTFAVCFNISKYFGKKRF